MPTASPIFVMNKKMQQSFSVVKLLDSGDSGEIHVSFDHAPFFHFLSKLLDKLFVTVFRLHRTARSAAFTVSMDLLIVCYLANAACAIINIMTAPIFIIVSRLHALFLVVPDRSFLHVLVAVARGELLFPTQLTQKPMQAINGVNGSSMHNCN